MKKRMKILILALCFTLLLSSAVYGAARSKTLTAYYNNIKIVVDGVPVTPRDATGSIVEPFIVDGSTYLPVRAVGEALGKTVSWDGNTQTVYIGNAPGEDVYLMDVCPPYQTGYYNAPLYSIMMGKKYFHGFELAHQAPTMCYAYINLNAEYSMLEFDFGHIDGSDNSFADYGVYLDGQYYETIHGTPDMTVQHITIPLNYALQLKITCEDGLYQPKYGFCNMILR